MSKMLSLTRFTSPLFMPQHIKGLCFHTGINILNKPEVKQATKQDIVTLKMIEVEVTGVLRELK